MQQIRSGNSEIWVDKKQTDIIEIVPMDDIILEIVWSDEHRRLICIAREKPFFA